jgi:hypothetical protein
MDNLVWLMVLSLFIGAYGTLIGAGGGFILVPLLLWVYPEQPPEVITSISLAVVSVNSISGMLAYARLKRIDYRAGLFLACASIPGAMLGAGSTALVSRPTFDVIFGVVLILSAGVLFFRPTGRSRSPDDHAPPALGGPSDQANHLNRLSSRRFRAAIVVSFLVGFVSSMLGIGGGIFQVPLMVHGLFFPVHAAVATSEFVLAAKAVSATSVHLATGTLLTVLPQVVGLSVGVFLGAQVGAHLSSYVHGAWIMRALAVSLGLIGVRFLVGGG